MEKRIENTNQILQGRLVVGDHDSLLSYGNALQIGLNDFSKSISNIVVRNNDNLEEAISDVADEIEKSQKILRREKGSFVSEKKQYFNLVRRYNAILGCIEKLELSFKLQQAQLIKDNKILDLLEEKLRVSIGNFEKLIDNGKVIVNSSNREQELPNRDVDIEDWYNRLEKKIEDLEVSLVIANQSIIQIKMMKENNYLMIDRIISVLSTTIPLWRNQVSIILGIERVHKDNQIQNVLMEMTDKQIEKSQKLLTKSLGKKTKLNYEELREMNHNLLNAIEEISDIEKKDVSIKQDFTKSLKL